MFEERDLPADLRDVRAEHAPNALVLDADAEFETLSPSQLDEIAMRTDGLSPITYELGWLPGDAPDVLYRIAGADLVIGYPEHGSVTWTRQTDPAVAIVRPRSRGSPADFVDFLIAEALVEIGLDVPEHFLGFFGERYRDLADLASGPGATYQLAAALYDGYVGRHTAPVFAGWEVDVTRLHDAWLDAGERLEPRLAELSEEVARGEVAMADAAEYACSAVKHAVDLPPPFEALDTAAYEEYGADYAIRWAVRVLGEDD